MWKEQLGCEYQPGGKKQQCKAPPPQPPFLPKEANPEMISLKLTLIFFLTSCPREVARVATSLAWSSGICCKKNQNSCCKIKEPHLVGLLCPCVILHLPLVWFLRCGNCERKKSKKKEGFSRGGDTSGRRPPAGLKKCDNDISTVF